MRAATRKAAEVHSRFFSSDHGLVGTGWATLLAHGTLDDARRWNTALWARVRQ